MRRLGGPTEVVMCVTTRKFRSLAPPRGVTGTTCCRSGKALPLMRPLACHPIALPRPSPRARRQCRGRTASALMRWSDVPERLRCGGYPSHPYPFWLGLCLPWRSQ